MPRVLLALALVGCGGEDPLAQETVPLSEGLKDNWVSHSVGQPNNFSSVIGPERSHWVALHSGEYKSILEDEGASELVQFRAHSELAAFYHRLARISRFAWTSMGETWANKKGLNISTELHAFPQLALHSGWVEPPQDLAPLGASLQARADETLGLEIDALIAHARKPTHLSEDGRVKVYDPLVFQALASAHRANLGQTPDRALGAVLFSACPEGPVPIDSSDSPHGYTCLDQGLFSALSLPTTLGEGDEAQVARELARDLDSKVDQWRVSLTEKARPDGKALLEDLNLVDIYRSRSLLALAEVSLDRDRPRQALALAQMSQDMSKPREISPLNPPLLFAILAEAQTRTGHTREALDYLEVLARAFPEVNGLDETVGDLAVLQGINRQGDSKEL